MHLGGKYIHLLGVSSGGNGYNSDTLFQFLRTCPWSIDGTTDDREKCDWIHNLI